MSSAVVVLLAVAVAAVVAFIVKRGTTTRLAAVETGIDELRQRMAADSETARMLLKELNQSVAARVDGLADWFAAGASPASRATLARDLDDRDFFIGTLSEAKIRPLQVAQLFPGIEGHAIEVGAIDPDTKLSPADMLYVCAIARHIRARTIFEFGTYLGRTTYHLALSPHVEQVYTLDLDPAAPQPDGLKMGRAVRAVLDRGLQGHFFRDSEVARRIVQLHGDSRSFDYGPYRKQMDFVFVDGGHTYDLVVNDTARALELVKPGGVIAWHDFAPKGRDVARVAREISLEHPLFWIEGTSLLVYIDGVDAMTYEAPTPVYARSVIKPA
jgi:predicted O-methyltransferase YrrM